MGSCAASVALLCRAWLVQALTATDAEILRSSGLDAMVRHNSSKGRKMLSILCKHAAASRHGSQAAADRVHLSSTRRALVP
jgi:hypothetical protein